MKLYGSSLQLVVSIALAMAISPVSILPVHCSFTVFVTAGGLAIYPDISELFLTLAQRGLIIV